MTPLFIEDRTPWHDAWGLCGCYGGNNQRILEAVWTRVGNPVVLRVGVMVAAPLKWRLR